MVKESPKDVINRANAKGLLDRIGTKKERPSSSNPPLPAAVQSKIQEWKGGNRPQNLLNRQQFSQGGHDDFCRISNRIDPVYSLRYFGD